MNKKSQIEEIEVYLSLVQFLEQLGWNIICGSPPSGTNARFHKCLIPRRDLNGMERGPRDEVDLIAYKQEVIVIIECKPKLSDSFSKRNILSETDYEKLNRIIRTFKTAELVSIIRRVTGLSIPDCTDITVALSVGIVDINLPEDITVFEMTSKKHEVWSTGILRDRFS